MLDLVVRDASIVDGTGRPAFPGWVGTARDRVATIGHGEPPDAVRTIEARGRVVCPGFVDVHNHSDLSPFVDRWMRSTLRQGITTVVVGNCGASPWPPAGWRECVLLASGDPDEMAVPGWSSWGEYLDAIDLAAPAVNIGTLIGHGAIRGEIMGVERRPPTTAELDAMRSTAAAAMADGALGLSSGLVYAPGSFAGTDELVALAAATGAAGGLYASHVRGEGAHLLHAVGEAIEIRRRAEIPVHVSHLKCESAHAWGRAAEVLSTLREADDVTADQYPYAAWCSSLASLLPPWAPADELGGLRGSERLRTAVESGEPGFQSSVDGVGWDAIVIVRTAEERWNGRDVASIAAETDREPFEVMVDLLEADPATSCIGHAMREDDVRTILADPEVFVATDGAAISPEGLAGAIPVHPREYGTFPRVLGRYVRDDRLLTLEGAIRKMTSLPADRFGLAGRGRLAVGAFADLVVFDPAVVGDAATFEAPHAYPLGVETVIVNGRVAWDGDWRDRAGRALRRGGG